MPHCINKGSWEEAELNAKIDASASIFAWSALMVLYLLDPPTHTSLGEWALTVGVITLALCTLGAVSVYRTSIDDGLYAERIMNVLGFSNPKVVKFHVFAWLALQQVMSTIFRFSKSIGYGRR